MSWTRLKTFRVTIGGYDFYVKAVDGGAINTLASQMDLPKIEKCERAPGHSKEALEMNGLPRALKEARQSTREARRKAIVLMEADGEFQTYLNEFAKGQGKHWLSNLPVEHRDIVKIAMHNAFLSGSIRATQRALGKETK